MSFRTSGPATEIAVDVASLTDAMSTVGNYSMTVPGTVDINDLIRMLRRLAEANGLRPMNVVRGGRTVWIEVRERAA